MCIEKVLEPVPEKIEKATLEKLCYFFEHITVDEYQSLKNEF